LNLLGSALFEKGTIQERYQDQYYLAAKSLLLVAGLLLASLALISLVLILKDGRGLGEYSFWISLLVWSFTILAFIVVGRLAQQEIGLQQGLAGYAHSRYSSYSILAIVAIYGLLATTTFRVRSSISTILLVLLSGAVLLGAGLAYSRGIEVGRTVKENRERGAYVLSTYKTQPASVFSNRHLFARRRGAEVIVPRAVILERLGYSVFADPPKAQRK
jgi:hypothetical protein